MYVRRIFLVVQVKKQTRDLAYLLRVAAGRANTYLFMEDDMRLCEGGLEAIKRILDKAYRCAWCMYVGYCLSRHVIPPPPARKKYSLPETRTVDVCSS